jgi:hypothetical protein
MEVVLNFFADHVRSDDDDGDSIVDTSDNCVLVPNASQLDTDGDGFGNM